MRYQDFGQFLFNSSIFDTNKLIRITQTAKNIQPTYSTTAIFMRLISMPELVMAFSRARVIEYKILTEEIFAECFRTHEPEIQKNFDAVVQKFLNPRRFKTVTTATEEPSIKLAQVLIDGALGFAEFEKVLDGYHKEEIPPVEKIFAKWYNEMSIEKIFEYLPALDVAKNFHSFLSDALKTTIIFSSTVAKTSEVLFGASVRIKGAMPIVVGVLAEKNVLHKLANSYDKFVSENLEEDFDAVAEMLNVFTGNFTVRVASRLGLEEELYPPRFGLLEKDVHSVLSVACDVGEFYLYIGDEEIFSN